MHDLEPGGDTAHAELSGRGARRDPRLGRHVKLFGWCRRFLHGRGLNVVNLEAGFGHAGTECGGTRRIKKRKAPPSAMSTSGTFE